MKKTNSKSPSVRVRQLYSEKFGKVKVVSDEHFEGYVCLNDLCSILNLSKQQVMGKLTGHLYIASSIDTRDNLHEIDFVDEFGVYVMYIMSKRKDTIQVQEWLEKAFFQVFHEKKKALIGSDKKDKQANESILQLEVLRYTATAANVLKSGHFKKGKVIPELTQSHLIGWWHNLNDQSTFLLQFNGKTNCCIFENIRMNIYLRKMVDGRINYCDTHITFLDLDHDNHQVYEIKSIIPSQAVVAGTVLDYIIKEQFNVEDLLDPKNLDLVIILNGKMSFHRSRRIMKKEQPLLEFI
jgi:prophage antirepressor-like protein